LFSPRSPARRIERPFMLRQRYARVIEEDLPCRRQLDTSRLPLEQCDAQLGFDLLDPLAERRLLHSQPLCGPRDMLLFGDGNELMKVTKLHGISSWYGCLTSISRAVSASNARRRRAVHAYRATVRCAS
jgi:hypothetical protein